jgi:CO/xanthine dehydrogenase FAD-binding subunit
VDLNTITEVVRPRDRDALPRRQAGDAWLSGGTWLFSEPQPHLTRLIDLTSLNWPAAEIGNDGLKLAATCTIAQLDRLSLPKAWAAAPLIGQCCRAFVASFKVWNTATVGGNICMALPAGPMIALAGALGGTGVVWLAGGGTRKIPITELVTGFRRTQLEPGDILRSIELPAAALMRRTAFRQMSLTPLGRSAALLIGTSAPRARDLELTITASTARPVRLAFPGIPDADELQRAISAAIPDSLYFNDVHGAPEWRKHLTFDLAESIRREFAGEAAP